MTTQRTRERRLIGLLLAIIFVYVLLKVVWHHYFAEENPQATAVASNTTQTISAPEQDEESAVGENEEEPEGESLRTARRIVKVPDQPDQTVASSEREVDLEIQETVKKMLESALSGNSEEAIALSSLLRECNSEYGEEWVKQQIAGLKNMKFSSETYISFGGGPQMQFDSLESIGDYFWNRHDQCNAAKSLFEDDLRARIKLLADNSVVTARFLYALWPPGRTGNVSEYTLKLLEYQQDALGYSWNNIDEREPLGVLAFALSYTMPGSLFTPGNWELSRNFLVAAKKCGLNSPWLDAQINTMFESQERMAGPDTAEAIQASVEAAAIEIKKLFCD